MLNFSALHPSYIKQTTILILLLFVFHCENVFAQEQELELARKYAEHSFREGDYDFALENYLKLYAVNKKDLNINFRIGVCYTETNVNKTGGIPYLSYVVSHNNFPREALFYLGKAYLYNYQFTEAVESLYEYKVIGTDEVLLASSERYIEMSYNALEFINQPKPVRFELVDTLVNSIYNDFRPLVTADESKIFFTSNRRYVDGLGTFVNDIYMSEATRSGWGQSAMLDISTIDHDEIVGIAPNGERIMIYTHGDLATHEIRMAQRKGKQYRLVEEDQLPVDLNSKAKEHGACINNEGTMIIFSSDRLGGYGGMDLYKIVKKDRRTWGPVENLGSEINTPFDENFPTLSVDAHKLHFSSNAHASIGGFDLFYSVFSAADSAFQRPINHGFPISSPFDDISISFNADESVAYVATNRNEGIGNLDIYKVHISKTSGSGMVVLGIVMVGDESDAVPYSSDFIKVYPTLYDTEGNMFSRYQISDEGMFFATLYPGEYILDVRFDKSEEGYREKLIITEPNEEQMEISLMIYLKLPK
ncbi:MAG: hypothetical protein RBR35_00330 [Salinivirgaceae bacterium]|nr:hypothetical protein [Salinivirgaceae bacterium]MDY0278989.1 hypothetical protein [Salinivirgaceae bacterium]